MIIRYLDIVCVAIAPPEAYAELIVDADAMLASTIPRQRLQPVTRRRRQILQPDRGIQKNELAASCLGDIGTELLGRISIEERFGMAIRERLDSHKGT
jgi:hypothetical protein